MTDSQGMPEGQTYLNPVHDRSCPDPFVLKWGGEFWAYCTGYWHDGRVFGVLHSRDLVHWAELGGAMEPLPGNAPCYWAPEVVYENGRFLMYYSVGNETLMEIRVGVAEHPAGPFRDSGRRLTTEDFAIDPHVFVDEDGARYLFYATDFLTHQFIGTGTVMDRMIDSFTLEGRPRPVTRARYDWQVYDPARKEKGGVRWHTVEGPTVLKHKGLYYEMFSGGNWQNTTYGVSYATSESLERQEEWEQASDGERVLPILRTLPGKVVGPGHNSVVRGPDNRQLFCVYHRWTEQGRVLAIDRLEWVGERMTVLGPTTTPQPAPIHPTFQDFVEGERDEELNEGWETPKGRWGVRAGEAVQEQTEGEALARCDAVWAGSFLLEVSLRAVVGETPRGSFGVDIYGADGARRLRVALEPEKRRIVFRRSSGDAREAARALPENFDFAAYHLLRIDADAARVHVSLDGYAARTQLFLNGEVGQAGLFTDGAAASFKGFQLTVGWQDEFDDDKDGAWEARGWQDEAGKGGWRTRERQLVYEAAETAEGRITKGPPLESYELIVNARLRPTVDGSRGTYGFFPALTDDDGGLLLYLDTDAGGWRLRTRGGSEDVSLPLPASFDPFVFQHFRFLKRAGRLWVRWENELLGSLTVAQEATRVGLYAYHEGASFDFVRVTMINAV